MRFVVFATTLVFLAGMAILTVLYVSANGVTAVGVLGVIVLVVVGVGVVGALLHPPRR